MPLFLLQPVSLFEELRNSELPLNIDFSVSTLMSRRSGRKNNE